MSHVPITDLSFIEQGATWPPPSEKWRIDRYKKNRQLWKGMHDEVYGNWWRVLREDKAATLELVFNWHKRLSTLWADMLVSEPPRFYDGDDDDEAAHKTRQEHLDRISGKDDNGYVTTLYEIGLDVSRYGDGVAKISLEEEGAAIWAQTPLYWFPVVAPYNLRKFTHHVLAWELKRNDLTFLWLEIHTKGLIEYRVHRLEGNVISHAVPVKSFSPDTPDVEETKVKDFLVVPFSGLRASDEIFGVDDYTDVDSVVQALEVRAALINNILDKHSDPSMYGPDDALEKDHNGEDVFKGGGRYFVVEGGNDNDVIPGYVVWDGQLEAAFKQLDFLVKQLYIISDTSPAAFGQLEQGLAESGSALRRLMQAPLSKVARIRMRFDPSTKRALRIAAALEKANGHGTPEIKSINVQWEDGLPPDPKEQAEVEQIRTANQPTSAQVSSIRRLNGGTQEEAEAEMERIREEQEAKSALSIAEEGERARINAEHAPPAGPDPPGPGKPQKTTDKTKERK